MWVDDLQNAKVYSESGHLISTCDYVMLTMSELAIKRSQV